MIGFAPTCEGFLSFTFFFFLFVNVYSVATIVCMQAMSIS